MKDFATRSLKISEETSVIRQTSADQDDKNAILRRYQMRRTWESRFVSFAGILSYLDKSYLNKYLNIVETYTLFGIHLP